ncbi:MAG: glycoside hydrolase family 127 protein [Prevotella sp.]|nr:glycoside hydrolase family 127 protein [Prevotella sp.]
MRILMTMLLSITLCVSMSVKTGAATFGNGYPISQVPFTAVKMTPHSFWGNRIQAAREVTIPLAFSKCESEHRYKNFEMAAYTLQHPSHDGLKTQAWDVSTFMGFSFDDTDVYKTIEGASYVLQTYPDEKLKAYVDSVLDIVAAAQESDGYLYTARTINPLHPHHWAGSSRWQQEEMLSHELYNLGHMVDAACAHYQATGSDKFLNIARRYADCVIREVGASQGQVCVVPGHQIAEMALARLYMLTSERTYLDEAKFLLDYRGKTLHRDRYSQSNLPVVSQREAWGHAVRAGYMYAGMADIAALTGDTSYIHAIDAITENIITRKYYLTGGVGARHEGESFGADYELPNLTAYNETCAAISMVYLFHRMFLLHGDARYIDCMERTLYNGVISGMSVDGGRFFYPNPLSSDGCYGFNFDQSAQRQPWFGCACCPSNLSRFIPSLPGYVYAVKDNSLYVNLFTANTATMPVGGKEVTVSQQTNYPWDGDITITIDKTRAKAFTMMVRLPSWAEGHPVPSNLYSYANGLPSSYRLSVNGQPMLAKLEKGYLIISRIWKKGDTVTLHLDMPVRTVIANPHVLADRGRIAVERGPLVYCAEGADNPALSVFNFLMPSNPQLMLQDRQLTTKEGVRFTVKALLVGGQSLALDQQGKALVSDATLTMIPYYAWNHRGPGEMQVWMAGSLEAVGRVD